MILTNLIQTSRWGALAARLCAEVKNDLVRQIRKVGVTSHGVKVRPLTSVLFCSLSIIVLGCVLSHKLCLLLRTTSRSLG